MTALIDQRIEQLRLIDERIEVADLRGETAAVARLQLHRVKVEAQLAAEKIMASPLPAPAMEKS